MSLAEVVIFTDGAFSVDRECVQSGIGRVCHQHVSSMRTDHGNDEPSRSGYHPTVSSRVYARYSEDL